MISNMHVRADWDRDAVREPEGARIGGAPPGSPPSDIAMCAIVCRAMDRSVMKMGAAKPIEDMGGTAAFAEPAATGDGRGGLAAMRVAGCDAPVDDRARERLMARIAVAERERAGHEGRGALEAVRDIRERHGL